MRRWLLDLHLYLGLACVPYVVLLGLSSLLLNHGIARGERSHWEEAVAPPGAGDERARANAVRDALGLRGSVQAHTLRREGAGALRFELIAPGRRYRIALGADGIARVDETDGGIAGIVRDLHGLRGVEASRWGPSWGLYTELTSFTLLFAVASGALLFWPRPGARRLGVGVGVAGLAMVVALAAGIW